MHNIRSIFSLPQKKSRNVLTGVGKRYFWQKQGFQSTLKRWVIWSGLLLLGMMVAVLFINLYSFTRWYIEPLAPFLEISNGRPSQNEWDGTKQLYVGLWLWEEGNDLRRNGILVVNPTASTAHAYILPDTFSAKNVSALSQFVSLPVDRYVLARQQKFLPGDAEAVITSASAYVSQNYIDPNPYLSGRGLIENIRDAVYTDFTPQELLYLRKLFIKFPEKIEIANWPSNSLELETVRAKVLVDPDILAVSPSIWVRNTTNIPNLASVVGIYLANLGFDVVRVDNADCAAIEIARCTGEETLLVTTEKNANSYAIKRVENIIGIKVTNSDGEDLKRADIVLLLGGDSQYLVGL